MNGGEVPAEPKTRQLRRVLILADESADWKIAGLRQLDRLALSLQDYAKTAQPHVSVELCVFWKPGTPESMRWVPCDARLQSVAMTGNADEFLNNDEPIDLIVCTRLFLYRDSVPQLLAKLPAPGDVELHGCELWHCYAQNFLANLPIRRLRGGQAMPWKYVSKPEEIPACERAFLRHNGKSQDGLVSRHLNRRISRTISRRLLRLPLMPSTWSVAIFALPLLAAFSFIQGTYLGFVLGAVIFQLYSILDGCDGEIARAKFLQTDFGRRLDSFLDLVGNMLLAFSIGIGLARQANVGASIDWFYISEGIAAAVLIASSEGILFVRRSRGENNSTMPSPRWNGALYQRHHEFLGRSGILLLGENVAWWLVQLTKRDMAMLAFVGFALLHWPAGILHLLFAVSAISSVLAANAFLRHPAPAVAQEAS